MACLRFAVASFRHRQAGGQEPIDLAATEVASCGTARSYAVQSTAAAPRPAPALFDGAARLRERTADRMREALAGRDGGVYGLVAYHLGWRDEHEQALQDAP